MSMCPPIMPPMFAYSETLARLTPFWIARRRTDEIIERDRRQIREYKRRLRKEAPTVSKHVGFTVNFSRGFYYVWFDCSSGMPSGIPGCTPLKIFCPDYIVMKCKLRIDQVDDMECRRARKR